MAEPDVFTVSQVAQHRSKNNYWLVIDGKVVDVSKFLEEHPGGSEVLVEVAGTDATKEFKDVGHSKEAQNILLNYQIGVLNGYRFENQETSKDLDYLTESANQEEMSAFIMKDDRVPMYVQILQFSIPLLVAISYLCCRYA